MEEKIEEILYSDSGIPETWAGSEESIPKDKRVAKLLALLTPQAETGEIRRIMLMAVLEFIESVGLEQNRDGEEHLTRLSIKIRKRFADYLNLTNKEEKEYILKNPREVIGGTIYDAKPTNKEEDK